MKAAVFYEVKQPLVVEEVELDDPKAGEVMVKIGAAGVCRSDRHFMHGDAPIARPVVLGHEGAGTVEKVGRHLRQRPSPATTGQRPSTEMPPPLPFARSPVSAISSVTPPSEKGWSWNAWPSPATTK